MSDAKTSELFTLYGFYTKADNTLVYVGVTGNTISRRLQGHRKFNKELYDCRAIAYFDTRELAEVAETALITGLNLTVTGLNQSTGPGPTGIKQSAELIAKRFKAREGYRHSEDTIKRMQESKQAKAHRIICNETGTVYDSIAEACRSLGLHSSKVSQVVRGKRKSVSGYTFKRVL